MMEDTQSDFTMTFRQLSEVSAEQLRNRNFTQVTEDFQSAAAGSCLLTDCVIIRRMVCFVFVAVGSGGPVITHPLL